MRPRFALRRAALAATLAPLLLACDKPEFSDAGKYELRTTLSGLQGPSHRSVLIDTPFDLELEGVVGGGLEPDGGGLGCVSFGASGVVTQVDARSFVVEGLGPGAVELNDPTLNCPANEDIFATLGPDRYSLEGVALAQVEATWIYQHDQLIRSFETSPGPNASFPDPIGAPLAPLRVVEDGTFNARAALVRVDAPDRQVRHELRALELHIPEHYEKLLPEPDEELPDPLPPSELLGQLSAGQGFDSSLLVRGQSLAMPPVEAVPASHVTQLSLVPVYGEGNGEREWGQPIGVLALTYGAEGERLVGAPVEWSLTRGRLALTPDADGAVLEDICRDPGQTPAWRGATVEASLGQLVASVDLEWVSLPSDREQHTAEQRARCTGASCNCSSTPAPSAPLLSLASLLGLLLLRRPRSRS